MKIRQKKKTNTKAFPKYIVVNFSNWRVFLDISPNIFHQQLNINTMTNISNALSRNTIFFQIICIKFRNNFPPKHHVEFFFKQDT